MLNVLLTFAVITMISGMVAYEVDVLRERQRLEGDRGVKGGESDSGSTGHATPTDYGGQVYTSQYYDQTNPYRA